MDTVTVVARENWQANLPEEIEFWRQMIGGTFPNQNWIAGLRHRIAGKHQFPGHLKRYLTPGAATRILDVASGPATTIGPVDAPSPVEIVAIDPLAETYTELLHKAGLQCWNPTRLGEGERLTELGLGTFDLVHSRNALDHAYDPLRVIREMLREGSAHPSGVISVRSLTAY
jgi:hypothetical protein